MERIVRTKVKDLLMSEPGKDVLAKGWVRTKRGNKNVAFIALNDGSTINNIQIVVDKTAFAEDVLGRITTGACIGVEGKLVESQGSGQAVEVQAESIVVYGEADRVDGFVNRVFDELGYTAPVVATGGLATTMAPLCHTVTMTNPELTLEGLRLVYEASQA